MSGILFLIIVGAAAGLIATRAMNIQANLPMTIGIGVAGALIGGLILRFMLYITGVFSGLIGAILGAVLLIWIWQKFQHK